MINKNFLIKVSTILDFILLLAITGVIFSFSRELLGISVVDIEGDRPTQIFLLSGYLLIILLTLILIPIPMRVNVVTLLVIGFIIWVLMSAFWSENLFLTLRRGIALLLTVNYAYILFNKYTSKGLIWLFGLVFAFVIVGSLFVIILFPEYSTSYGSYEWKGLFSHRNALGRFSALSITTFYYLFRTSSKRLPKAVYFVLIIISSLLFIMSKSTTGYVLLVSSIGLLLYLKFTSSFKKFRLVFLLIVIVLVGLISLFVFNNIEAVTAWLGKDPTLTGRTLLWEILIQIGLNQPFGFGYGSFWVGTASSTSSAVYSTLSWNPTHAHNGFLDVWLQLGWPGLAIISLIIYITILNLFLYGIKQNIENVYWLVIFAFLVFYNVSESNLMAHNSIYTILFCLAGFLSSGRVSVKIKASDYIYTKQSY